MTDCDIPLNLLGCTFWFRFAVNRSYCFFNYLPIFKAIFFFKYFNRKVHLFESFCSILK